ncbi:MAG: hypothetical protein K2Q28_00705 [Hyphomicrobium sp.]|nr:hypothetical protein [Hyphomicrobium sp.]
MAQKTAARGRPKGTGLDDAGPLAAIAELIAANPGMKPTTAIKALGFTDPSTVRRLRDKYQQRRTHHQAAAPSLPAASTPHRTNNVIALRARGPAVRRDTAPAPENTGASLTSHAPTGEDASPVTDEHPAQPQPSAKPDLFVAAYAASIATAKTAIHLHYKSLWYAFHWSPFACAIRNAEYTRLVLSSLKNKDDNPRCSRPSD